MEILSKGVFVEGAPLNNRSCTKWKSSVKCQRGFLRNPSLVFYFSFFSFQSHKRFCFFSSSENCFFFSSYIILFLRHSLLLGMPSTNVWQDLVWFFRKFEWHHRFFYCNLVATSVYCFKWFTIQALRVQLLTSSATSRFVCRESLTCRALRACNKNVN